MQNDWSATLLIFDLAVLKAVIGSDDYDVSVLTPYSVVIGTLSSALAHRLGYCSAEVCYLSETSIESEVCCSEAA